MAEEQRLHDALISEFVGIAGVTPQVAQKYLAENAWDYGVAVTEYFNRPKGIDEDNQAPETPAAASSAPQPIPTSSSMPPPPSAMQAPKKKFATLGDLSGGGGPSHGDDDDDDDDDFEPSDDDNPDLYAGGEKSGLAVENPNNAEKLRKKIIKKAQKNTPRPGGDDPSGPSSRFTGTARTLGGDDTPSQTIEDPNASRPQRAAPVERRLHFWADGFSVDDGPLYRSDDPANAAILGQIKTGRAPIAILNVQPGQEVDVKLDQHSEKYVQPKKKYMPFGGGGQRLGSPTPGVSSRTAEPAPAPLPAAAAAAAASTQVAAVDVNESQPTLSLQIRLGDGTRLPARFNTTHTIGDVYSFVMASNPASRTRSWVLLTTFPSKELSDKSQVLGDLSEFKRGGVVVQKWS
ncbi:MAG: UBX domain-containing protein 1 [Alectoria fallacina]|uniref:UBX domain-containing protein 1 n=1 Tax=Alectoria fallacina TaxID=1903189 RepID=A0A8H3I7C3_9LECA|nr:MAG: UBX domain-containing protein 1 [Alectoria fallacina]